MTLHDAIVKVLENNSIPMSTWEIAAELNKNKWYRKKDGSEVTPFQIHGRTRNYSKLFEREGNQVKLKSGKRQSVNKKPPNWQRDEIILALDLYHSIEPKDMDDKNPKVIALSELLNKLPIHKEKNNFSKFRNPSGVNLKLNNFKAIDPNYEGKGMSRHSRLDKEIFFEFENNKVELKRIANQIKNILSNENLKVELNFIDDELGDEIYVKEGRVIYKLHRHRERNKKLNRKKKENYLTKHGKLDCEVCGFDFYASYGELGYGFMECHHRIPLSEIEGESTTSLRNLALVCSNCHRMLHKGIDTLSITELKDICKKHSQNSHYSK